MVKRLGCNNLSVESRQVRRVALSRKEGHERQLGAVASGSGLAFSIKVNASLRVA
jgi:hypothetical protein